MPHALPFLGLRSRFFVVGLLCLAAWARGEEPVPVLITHATSEVRARPDEVILTLGVTQQRESAREAQELASGAASAVVQALRDLGIPQEQLQTQRLTLQPVYAQRRFETPEARIVAYRASNLIRVRVGDLDRAGSLIDAALAAGANEIKEVEFRLRDETELHRQALQKAVREAARKAEAMAEALGVTLLELLEVNDTGSGVMRPQYLFAAREAAAMETPVMPGEISIHANVSLRYRIGPEQR